MKVIKTLSEKIIDALKKRCRKKDDGLFARQKPFFFQGT